MPTISLHMIVRNEEANLPRLLDSVRAHVDRVIIADTGSTDRTKEVAAGYGATVIDCNPTTHPMFFFVDDEATLGPIGCPPPFSGAVSLGNFGGARAVSFALGAGDFQLWLDADDRVRGAENLRPLAEQMAAGGFDVGWFLYEYGRDNRGRVACELWRERLVRRGSMIWANPIHEVMVPSDPTPRKSIKVPSIVVEHHRPPERSAVVAHRNYKVLLRHLQQAPNDARTLFYFGNEARFIKPDQAIIAYEKYVELSGWAEERCMARCYLGEIYEQAGNIGRAYANFAAAAADDPRMPDGWYGMARIAYRRQDWAECVRLTEEGAKRGTPDTVIMVNPMTRSVAPHIYYNVALNAVGRVQDAHDACSSALAIAPEEFTMRHNLGRYRAFLDERAAAGEVPHPLSPAAREGIALAIAPRGAADAPGIASDHLLEAAAMRLWKACLAGGEPDKAAQLLRALPASIASTVHVDIARRRSAEILSRVPEEQSPFAPLGARYTSHFAIELPIGVGQPAWDAPTVRRQWSVADVRDELDARGFEAVDAHPRDKKLVVRARPKTTRSQDVVFWAGPSVEPWNPRTPETSGIGGSETACIEVAHHLAALGRRVTVYSDCPGAEGVYGGVEYRHFSRFGGCDCDVFVSSRQPQVMEHDIRARAKFLWVHDIHVGQPDPNMHRWLLRFDRLLCLSKWHRDLVLQAYPWLHPSSVIVTRNGIDPARFAPAASLSQAAGWGWDAVHSDERRDNAEQWFPTKRNRLIYSSSPNRGLDALLDVWPIIQFEVPDAELHVFYGFESWERSAEIMGDAGQLAQIAGYKARLASTPGVHVRGRVDQATLAREMMMSKVWAYPTAFTETYCITAIEAQAAGCIPVTSDLAALHETVRYGVRLSGSNADPAYRDAFVRECVNALTDEARRSTIAGYGRGWALTQTWETLAAEWAKMFDDVIGDAGGAVPRYVQMLDKKAA